MDGESNKNEKAPPPVLVRVKGKIKLVETIENRRWKMLRHLIRHVDLQCANINIKHNYRRKNKREEEKRKAEKIFYETNKIERIIVSESEEEGRYSLLYWIGDCSTDKSRT